MIFKEARFEILCENKLQESSKNKILDEELKESSHNNNNNNKNQGIYI